MRQLATVTFVLSLLSLAPLEAQQCSDSGGCGPDNNFGRASVKALQLVVPTGMVVNGTVDFDAGIEQAVVGYSASFVRIGRRGTHEGADLPTQYKPGIYFITGWNKDNGAWLPSDTRLSQAATDDVRYGFDDRVHDGDFNDSLFIAKFVRTTPVTQPLVVNPTVEWVHTGVFVNWLSKVELRFPNGHWNLGATQPFSSAAGLAQPAPAGWLKPGARKGVLLARVGGKIVAVGKLGTITLTFPEAGELLLSINDEVGKQADNLGFVSGRVTVK